MPKFKKRLINVAQANLPESGKKGLLRPASKRPPRAFRLFNRKRVTSVGGHEWGNNLRAEAKRRRWWRPIYATPNSREWGNIQAVGILLKTRQADLLDRHEISAAGYHIPIALIRKVDFNYVHIAAHVPTKRVDNAARVREEYSDGLHDYIKSLGDTPWVLTVDSNAGGEWTGRFKRIGGHVMQRDYVDVIMASSHFKKRRGWKARMERITYHKIIGVNLKATRPGKQISKLPKP